MSTPTSDARKRRATALLAIVAVTIASALSPASTRTHADAPAPAATQAGAATGSLLFDDEFNGSTLDTSQWIALNRDGDSSNSEQQCYLPSNVTVSGGVLTLADRHQSVACVDGNYRSYTSAMVQTASFNFTYGTVEIRARMPSGQGQWPALWLLGHNCQATNPTTADNSGACQWPVPGSNEIDLFEGQNTATTTGFFNLHTGTSPNNDDEHYACNGVSLPIDTSTGYHVYDLIWQPGSLTWQIDGNTYCSTTANVPNTAMFLILNIALGGSFTGGTIDSSVMPQTMQVDYVRVYGNAPSATPTQAPPTATPTQAPPTATPTDVPSTPTAPPTQMPPTSTAVPATATSTSTLKTTRTSTATSTVVPATATPTNIPPTATDVAPTPKPTSAAMATDIPLTPTPTDVPPTPTRTPVPPEAKPTGTSTATAMPATATAMPATATAVSSTARDIPRAPSSTPTATPTSTATVAVPTTTATGIPPARTATPARAKRCRARSAHSRCPTLGLTRVGAVQDDGEGGYLNGSRITTGSSPETVQSLSAYIGAVQAAPYNRFAFGIYEDNNGKPGALVAHSASGTLKAYSWNTLSLTARLDANAAYWLQYSTNATDSCANNMYMKYVSSPVGSYTSGTVRFGIWPTKYGVATLDTVRYSIYATVNP